MSHPLTEILDRFNSLRPSDRPSKYTGSENDIPYLLDMVWGAKWLMRRDRDIESEEYQTRWTSWILALDEDGRMEP